LRSAAREKKDFSIADKIRDCLGQLEIVLEDRGSETDWTAGGNAHSPESVLHGLMQLVIELRKVARDQKDFATADEIRDRLADLHIVLEDRADETQWTIAP
jgi:cysteinyl-tRNA synthetase